MKEYTAYKKWWIEYEAPHRVPSLYYGEEIEEAFEQHINDMGLYRLMETLEDWQDEV